MADFDPNVPIYIQIMNAVKKQIITGALKSGDRLPSVREQAEALSVNPNTIQRAYQELEREGICESRRGMGSWIVEKEGLVEALRDLMARSIITLYMEEMHSLGLTDAELVSRLERAVTGGDIQ
jgi:GntR family transcriptional regulator